MINVMGKKAKHISFTCLFITALIVFFCIPSHALTLSDTGIRHSEPSWYVYPSALGNDGRVTGFNRETTTEVVFSLMFTGPARDSVVNKLTQVKNGESNINDVIIFGDGKWYYSLEILNITDVDRTGYSFYNFKSIGINNFAEIISPIYKNIVTFKIKYNQPFGKPTTFEESTFSYHFTNVDVTDFHISLPWYQGNNFDCYLSIDEVNITAPAGQLKYIVGGDNPLNVYGANTFLQHYQIAQMRFYDNDPTQIRDEVYTYQEVEYKFKVIDEYVELKSNYNYSVGGDENFAYSPKVQYSYFKSTISDFTISAVKYTTKDCQIDGKPLYMTLNIGRISHKPTEVQKNYKPFGCLYSSFTFTDTVTITQDGASMGEYDVSDLYVDMTFTVPETNDDESTIANIRNFFVGLITSILEFVGKAFYNSLVWIFCETPVLSSYTKPLFMLAIRTGDIFTQFFIPILGALGIFAPLLFTFFFISFVKKHS